MSSRSHVGTFRVFVPTRIPRGIPACINIPNMAATLSEECGGGCDGLGPTGPLTHTSPEVMPMLGTTADSNTLYLLNVGLLTGHPWPTG